MRDPKRIGTPHRATFQSDPQPHRTVRRIVKNALRKGQEPEPTYRTRKFWID